MPNNLKITFWGSSLFSVFCLDELKKLGLIPSLIITTIDKPTGRGLVLTPTPVKVWAVANGIDCLTPNKLDQDFTITLKNKATDIFLVASYGKIMPQNIVDLPKYKTLNIHPSLLPKYRGPSPIQTQILNGDKNIGVTLMLMDEKMDHGPIIAQKDMSVEQPLKTEQLKEILAVEGAKLFSENLENWISGKIKPVEQNHDQATFTKKTEKADGLIDIVSGDPYQNFLKIQAYSLWPQAYFFVEKAGRKIRVIVKGASFADNILTIKRVVPEGKKEMNYEDFLRGLK